jgi:hypothetical protein
MSANSVQDFVVLWLIKKLVAIALDICEDFSNNIRNLYATPSKTTK